MRANDASAPCDGCARTSTSRSLPSCNAATPVASSKPAAPIGPAQSPRARASYTTVRSAANAPWLRPGREPASISGVTTASTSSVCTSVACRCSRSWPRTPMAMPPARCARRTVAHGARSRLAEAHAGASAAMRATARGVSRTRSCGRSRSCIPLCLQLLAYTPRNRARLERRGTIEPLARIAQSKFRRPQRFRERAR